MSARVRALTGRFGRIVRLCMALAALALLLMACSGDSDDTGPPTGISTRTPVPATTDAPIAATGTSPSTPPARSTTTVPARTSTPAFIEVEPDEAALALAALAGENPAEIAFLLDNLEPRCDEDRATLLTLTERTWRHLNETQGIAIPVASILGRILQELPPGESTHACEPLMAAVIVSLRAR